MKRLVALTDIAPADQEALVRALALRGVKATEVPGGVFTGASLWVEDADYARAKPVLETHVADIAERERERWLSEWRERWGGSYLRWFFGRIRENPRRLGAVALLVIVLWIAIMLPLWLLR